MQEAGTVLHLARSGRLIIRASSQLKDGTLLVDQDGRRAGKVMETIGSVSAPYLSAQPLTDRIERIVGTKLYVSEEVREERRERRYGGQYNKNKRGPPRRHFPNKRSGKLRQPKSN